MVHKNEFDGNLVYGGRSFHKETKRDGMLLHGDVIPHLEFVERVGLGFRHKSEYFETLSQCFLCDSINIELKFEKSGLNIFKCNSCSFGFQNPRFKREYLSQLYGKDYSMIGTYLSEAQNELDEIKYQYAFQELRKFQENTQSALDIGAGNLQFLKICKKNGVKRLYGIEPGSNLGESKEFHVITEFSDEIPSHIRELSLITMWDSLEHIHGPQKIIKSCYDSLQMGGVLIILVPNFDSLASRLIREKSPTFCIYHLNYYTDRSLSKLLADNGFDILQKETVISEIDNCRNYLEFKEPYLSQPSNEVAFDWLSPDYIHDNMLGSRLFFIAKKR